MHKKMHSNLIVNCGKIEFTIEDGRDSSNTYGLVNKFILSEDLYARLTIPPGVWLKFRGLDKKNSLLNIASIMHDPKESLTR
jgi:dTDP-4-dehydrorhamnose 3,5-epimerase